MRRKNQQLSREETEKILCRGTSGTLAVLGDEGYPYAVPVSYVYVDGAIYFHCAKSGHKLDAIRACEKVSFCVVDRDQVVPEEYTTYFRSAIAFGRAEEVSGEELQRAIVALAEKYYPEDTAEHRNEMIQKELPILVMVKIKVEHLTGKEAIELVRAGKK